MTRRMVLLSSIKECLCLLLVGSAMKRNTLVSNAGDSNGDISGCFSLILLAEATESRLLDCGYNSDFENSPVLDAGDAGTGPQDEIENLFIRPESPVN